MVKLTALLLGLALGACAMAPAMAQAPSVCSVAAPEIAPLVEQALSIGAEVRVYRADRLRDIKAKLAQVLQAELPEYVVDADALYVATFGEISNLGWVKNGCLVAVSAQVPTDRVNELLKAALGQEV